MAFDGFSADGAAALVNQIESYWRERGKVVRCRVERFADPKLGGAEHPRHQIRSDMLNGMPRNDE